MKLESNAGVLSSFDFFFKELFNLGQFNARISTYLYPDFQTYLADTVPTG